MNVFEPLFLVLVAITIGTLITAAVAALRGGRQRAGRILRRLGVGAALYFAVVIVVSIVSKPRLYRVGDPQCFDDWCITVTDSRSRSADAGVDVEVSLRLLNRARRVPMGEKGTVVYLTDAQGRRFDPLPDPAGVRLDSILQPGESVIATRRFRLPVDARNVGLVYTHQGGFPIGWLIISEGGWFQRPPIVRLD
jgi:hypothetical protein